MELAYICILFLVAIFISNILNHFFPYFSLPLIQIVLGILIGMVPITRNLQMDPNLFMVLVISPVIFQESRKINTKEFWKLRKRIFILAFPVVFISVIVLAYFFNWIVPVIPLAGCFALSAALSPTDAVAVSSLSSRISVPRRVIGLLEGESLINDASGVLAFQLSVAALLTGAFSLWQTTWQFLIICLGGILIGVLVAALRKGVISLLRRYGLEDTKLYLTLDIILPFAAYCIAAQLNVSGILAVVVMGLIMAATIKKNDLFEARLSYISVPTWDTLVFILNALVFILLGVQIPHITSEVWNIPGVSHWNLIFLIVASTIALFIIRFVCIWVIRIFSKNKRDLGFRTMLVMTFAGVKGTISLATIFALPFVLADGSEFRQRSLIIFIAAGVILLSLIIAIIALPFLSKSRKREEDSSIKTFILLDVIEQLQLQKEEHNKKEYDAVIAEYQKRIYDIEQGKADKKTKDQEKKLQLCVFRMEREGLQRMYDDGAISDAVYAVYNKILTTMEARLTNKFSARYQFFKIGLRRWSSLIIQSPSKKKRGGSSQSNSLLNSELARDSRLAFVKNRTDVLEKLQRETPPGNEKIVRHFVLSQEHLLKQMKNDKYLSAAKIKNSPKYETALMHAYQIERNLIQSYYERREISIDVANEMRQNINMLETYSMGGNKDNLLYSFMEILSR